MDLEDTTAPVNIRCCACGALYGRRAGWRQKSLYVLADPGALFAYLCGTCASRFSSEAAVNEFLDTELERLVLRHTRRFAAC